MLLIALSLLSPLALAQEGAKDESAPAEAAPAEAAPAAEEPAAAEPAAAEPAASAPVESAPAEAAPAKQWRWAALPIGNYSSTYGVGYGAYGNIVNNGVGDLGDDPYRAKFALQIYHTTIVG